MADPTFFDLFKSTWAQNGLTEGITDLQYKTGWSFIGSVPPSVEQFNKVQQTTDERLAWLYKQLDGLAAVTGRPLTATGVDALSYAQQNLNATNLKTGTVPVARLSGTASTLTAGAAQKLATARTIATTGDAISSGSFDGSANLSLGLTLSPSGVTAGSYGNANAVPTFTVDAKGRVSAAGEVALGNASTATKLAAARTFSVTGGATAGGVGFDGSGNVALNVTALDVSKANAGTLPVSRGGTGVATVAAGTYLTGAGAGAVVSRTPAQVLEDIQALPKVGGDVSGPVLLGAGATIGAQYGVNTAAGRTAHVLLPDGGGYSSNTGTITGAMKITLPAAAIGANTMLRLRVDIFEYLDGVPPVSILIHGYVQTTKAWTRCGVTVLAGSAVSDLPVRFGADVAGNLCIWLGDTTKSWSYPSVTVAEVLAKYNTSGATVAAWGVGWKVEPVTALETVLQTLAGENLAFARADIARVSGLQDALDLKANTAVTMVAGNGLSGGGTLSANRTFALGTPGKLTAVSTNAVTTASHTHELDTQTGKMDATAGRILLVGAFGIGAENPLDTNDLNTITIPGKYGQSANPNATFARNYPIANAGTLDVSMAGTYIVTQTYTAFSPLRVFVRARTSPTVWSAWTELASVDQAASAAPAGLTGFFAQSSAPVGWLKANGTAASVAAYPDLVNAIYRGDASNATAPFGYRCTNAANPSGTRNVAGSFIVLPDLRGEFVRGWDDARGIDPTRSYGTAQQDVFREHIHSYGVYTGGDGGGRVIAGGYENGNNHSDVVIGGVGSAMNSLGQFIGGSETRPRNVALLACIKY